jgi:hypothetical protein
VVKTKQAIKRGAANITRYRDFFETWSDSRNWNDEMTFGKPVLNIWKKS